MPIQQAERFVHNEIHITQNVFGLRRPRGRGYATLRRFHTNSTSQKQISDQKVVSMYDRSGIKTIIQKANTSCLSVIAGGCSHA